MYTDKDKWTENGEQGNISRALPRRDACGRESPNAGHNPSEHVKCCFLGEATFGRLRIGEPSLPRDGVKSLVNVRFCVRCALLSDMVFVAPSIFYTHSCLTEVVSSEVRDNFSV